MFIKNECHKIIMKVNAHMYWRKYKEPLIIMTYIQYLF